MPAFPPFRPDAGELLSGEVSDVFITVGGYGPRPSLQAAPGAVALPAAPRGAFGTFLPDGTFLGFAATASSLYKIDADWDFTSLGGTLNLPSDEDQAFTAFGVFLLISNTSSGMKGYNMDSPAGLGAVAGAPAARYLFNANNQVVALGNGSALPSRLLVSAFGDHTNWSTKGASKQDLNDGGAFTGGGDLGGGIAIIAQDRALRRMTFGNAGGGALFRLDKIAEDVGCVHPRAQAIYNGIFYCLHTDGFWKTAGGAPINIGAGKVNEWFLKRCTDLKKVSASVDPKNTIIRWRYPAAGDGSSATVFNSYLDYNWVADEFVPGIEPSSAFFRMGTPAQTLDTLAALGPLNNWSQFPIGSAFFQGGNYRLAGLDAAYRVAFFEGPNAAATLETPTQGDGRSNLVSWCEPITDDGAVTVRLGVKERMADQFTWSDPAVGINAKGLAQLRGRGRYDRIRLIHAAGASWTKDVGVEGIVRS